MLPDSSQRLRRTFVGLPLRTERLSQGLTQMDVAKELGWETSQFVSNIERGISYPPDTALPVLAKVLKLKPAVLVEMIEKAELELLKAWKKQAMKVFKNAKTDDH